MKSNKHEKSSFKSVKIKEKDYLLLEEIRLFLLTKKKIHLSKSELFSNILDHGKKLLET